MQYERKTNLNIYGAFLSVERKQTSSTDLGRDVLGRHLDRVHNYLQVNRASSTQWTRENKKKFTRKKKRIKRALRIVKSPVASGNSCCLANIKCVSVREKLEDIAAGEVAAWEWAHESCFEWQYSSREISFPPTSSPPSSCFPRRALTYVNLILTERSAQSYNSVAAYACLRRHNPSQKSPLPTCTRTSCELRTRAREESFAIFAAEAWSFTELYFMEPNDAGQPPRKKCLTDFKLIKTLGEGSYAVVWVELRSLYPVCHVFVQQTTQYSLHFFRMHLLQVHPRRIAVFNYRLIRVHLVRFQILTLNVVYSPVFPLECVISCVMVQTDRNFRVSFGALRGQNIFKLYRYFLKS